MSITKVIYIEVRNPDKDTWNLYHHIVKQDLVNDKDKYSNIININGTNYVNIIKHYKEGVIRDILSDYDYRFNCRNFPNNMSDELKDIIDRETDPKEIFNISYATFYELENQVIEKKIVFENKFNEIKSKYQDQSKFDELNEKLNLLLRVSCRRCLRDEGYHDNLYKEMDNYVSKNCNNSSPSKIYTKLPENEYNAIIEDYEDLLNNFTFFLEYIRNIYYLIEYSHSNISKHDIRLVYYSE